MPVAIEELAPEKLTPASSYQDRTESVIIPIKVGIFISHSHLLF